MKPRLLANENFPAPSIRLLRDQGYDVAAVAEGEGSLADPDVLALAVAEKRWIVRMRSYRPDDPGRVLAGLLDSGPEFDGHFVLVEEAGLRKRPLPEQKSVRG